MFLHISDGIHLPSKCVKRLSTQSASVRIHNLSNIKRIVTEYYVQQQYTALLVCSHLHRFPVPSVNKSSKYAPLHFISTAWQSNTSVSFPLNPLNAKLIPICHSLILLGDLTFMGTCIVNIFQYISNKMQGHIIYLYLETALYVSGGTFTHY